MTQDSLYKEIILEHWENPQNSGVLDHADIDISSYNPLCGDTIRITALIKDDVIFDIAFTGQGCAISIAYASVLTEEIKHMKIEQIRKLKPQFILDLVGITLTPSRLKCALLCFTTLQKGVNSKKAGK